MSKTTILQSLPFGTQEINYELSFQKRKTFGIRVYPDCKIKVIAPLHTPSEEIDSILRKKAPWIIKQQRTFASYHPLTPPQQYVSGETHLYLGRQYRLRIQKAPKNEVTLRRGRLLVFKKETSSTKDLLTTWYRQKATMHFEAILHKSLPLFRRYDIKAPQLHIRQMRTRWGSCTPQGKITLNLALIKAPKTSIQYVMVHELCHLIHYNHTKAFYQLQTSIMPDWNKWKERLEYTLK